MLIIAPACAIQCRSLLCVARVIGFDNYAKLCMTAVFLRSFL